MIQYYLYEVTNTCTMDDFNIALATMQESIVAIETWDAIHGAILIEEENDVLMRQFLQVLMQDFDFTVRFMRAYAYNEFTRYLLTRNSKLLGLFQDGEAFFKILIEKDDKGIALLRKELHLLTRDDYETINTYISSDLNAIKTSEYMYLHRNTLAYRLQRIYDKTGFDIRNYHHALLLHQYILITRK